MEGLWGLLGIIGPLQGLLLALLLTTRKHNQQANRWLACFTVIYSLGLMGPFAKPYPFLAAFLGGTEFLYGPFIYLYLRQLLQAPPKKAQVWYHFIPFLCYVLLISGQFALKSTKVSDYEGVGILILGVLYFHIFAYSYAAIRLVLRKEKTHQRQPLKGISFTWIKGILFGLTGLYLFAFLLTSTSLGGFAIPSLIFQLVGLGCVVLVYVLSYYTLLQAYWNTELKQNPEKDRLPKYNSSSLDDWNKKALLEQIETYMFEEKPYLDPNLTIETFANTLKINRYYISQVINEKTQRNFPDYINAHRIEAAKGMLQDPNNNHLTMLAIGFDAGFNSKTTFNTTFKRMTGMSPSQYKKSHLAVLSE